jgi:CDP-glucose 4,6-dehydratase
MWKGKKVLITGIEGFIGSNLVEKLKKEGAEIYGIELPGKESEHNLLDCDLNDLNQTIKTVSDLNPDIIFHLGGQALPSKAEEEPLETFKSNVITTLHLLEAIRKTKTPFIYASTREVYDKNNALPYVETQKTENETIYGCTKITSDKLVSTYFKSYGLPVAIIRASNTYGPKDMNFRRIIPRTIKSEVLKENLVLYGDGSPSRDYIFVEDLVRGYLSIGESLFQGRNFGEAFNLAGKKPFTVKEIVSKIKGISGSEIEMKFDEEDVQEKDAQYASSEKAKKLLNWVPEICIDEGLKKTYDWYKNNI